MSLFANLSCFRQSCCLCSLQSEAARKAAWRATQKETIEVWTWGCWIHRIHFKCLQGARYETNVFCGLMLPGKRGERSGVAKSVSKTCSVRIACETILRCYPKGLAVPHVFLPGQEGEDFRGSLSPGFCALNCVPQIHWNRAKWTAKWSDQSA